MTSRLLGTCFLLLFAATTAWGGPKGAKALFESGEGSSTGMSVGSPKASKPVARTKAEPAEKYVGISYQLMLVKDDGSFQVVTKKRTFRSGERLKVLVRANRPGYMTVMNIGSSGNTHVLFNDYVDAYAFTEIPRNTNMKFVGEPGTEKLLIMLSDGPNPLGGPPPVTTASAQAPATTAPAAPPQEPAPAPYTPPTASTYPAAEPVSAPLPAPPPPTVVASNIDAYQMEGNNSKSIGGAKDIVMEDEMQSSYAVINPRDGYRPKKAGMKDIVLESSGGNNYGVVPVSAVSGGGILTLEVKLKHK